MTNMNNEQEHEIVVQIGVILNTEDDINELLNEAKTTALCEMMDGLTADELDGVVAIDIKFDAVFSPEKNQYVITGTMDYIKETVNDEKA